MRPSALCSRLGILIKHSSRTKMKKLLYIVILASLVGCKEEAFEPSSAFTRIYDSNRGSEGYYPIDFIQTSAGYTILTGQTLDDSDYLGVKLIRVDEEGTFLFEDNLTSDYVVPIGDMVSIDSVGYFFAMEPTSLNPVLFEITDSAYNATEIAGLDYPLAANTTSSATLLLLSYNLQGQEMTLSEISTDGELLPNSTRYAIGAGSDYEGEIFEHYTDPERGSLPFFCGEWSADSYYFNGIYNYSMSLVFSSLGSEPTGVVQGQGLDGGMVDIMPIQGSQFALFGYQFNENFIVPNTTINTSGTTSSVNYLETTVSEFASRANAEIVNWQTETQSYTIIGAETESRQIALYFYETTSGELVGIHKLGYINPYTLSSMRVDSEGNLVILGTTYISGRFKRVFLTKMSTDDLHSIIN